MRTAPIGRLLALLGLAMLLSACALTRLKAPDVQPTSVELMDVALDRQRFKVGMHVQNPNDRALPIKSVNCTLEIQDIEVGQGEIAEPFNVPANGETDVDMIVTMNAAASVPNLILRIAQGGGQLPTYHLSGSVNPDIAWLPPIPFSKSGQITLPN